MKRPRTVTSLSKLSALLLLSSALAFAAQQPDSSADLFRQKVAPILAANCTFCHGAKIQRSGLDLRTAAAVLKGGARGAAVVPGQPEKSTLWRMITHREEPAMPMGMAKLAEAEIAVITEWIAGLPKEAAPVAAENTPVRAVYIYVKRSVLLPLIEVFDCPVTTVSAPQRPVSTVSPQALALMNNEFVLAQAGYFAGRVKREAGSEGRRQIKRAFAIALNRLPNAQELAWSASFLKTQTEGYQKKGSDQPETAALCDFCHAIFNLNEFVYVD